MNNKYEEIINLPQHVSKRHPPMSMAARAAQFGSFAALKGHDDAIKGVEKFYVASEGEDNHEEDEENCEE